MFSPALNIQYTNKHGINATVNRRLMPAAQKFPIREVQGSTHLLHLASQRRALSDQQAISDKNHAIGASSQKSRKKDIGGNFPKGIIGTITKMSPTHDVRNHYMPA